MSNRLAFSVGLEGEDSAPHASSRPWPWLCLGLCFPVAWFGRVQPPWFASEPRWHGDTDGNGIQRIDVACTTVSGLGVGSRPRKGSLDARGQWNAPCKLAESWALSAFQLASSVAVASRVYLEALGGYDPPITSQALPPRPHGPRTESSAPVRRQNATRTNQGPKPQPPYLGPDP
ncbi:hypothetical protein PaG_05751 [Moesziomyces aphidis]|uniref:Uncharacterized protein n=1 Tax=Moesziomyces aphidis TaxID=84754 RepID=W3VF67_MOEAP|nr:hypothetical protein PaG_05751 [Moesziomyces aphidis]